MFGSTRRQFLPLSWLASWLSSASSDGGPVEISQIKPRILVARQPSAPKPTRPMPSKLSAAQEKLASMPLRQGPGKRWSTRWPGIAALLVGCATSTAGARADELPALAAVEAPQLDPWPEGLPDAVETDTETRLPKMLADAVDLRMGLCERLPGLAEVALEEQRRVCEVVRSEALRIQAARLVADQLADRADAEGRWPHWVVFLAVTGAIVLGGVIGLVGGWMTAQ